MKHRATDVADKNVDRDRRPGGAGRTDIPGATHPKKHSAGFRTMVAAKIPEDTDLKFVRFSPTAVIAVFIVSACIANTCAQAPTVEFSNQTSSFLAPAANASVLFDTQSRRLITNDFDQDGDIDVVIVRRTSSFGALPSVFLQNVGGALDDRTTMFAQASMVAGSAGFLDSTVVTDAVAVDVNGDGWTDVVTAVQWNGGSVPPKYIGYPRVYINLGLDAFGQWSGFMFDDEDRIPNFTFNPAFRCLDAGDVDQDGDADLYFGNVDIVGNSSSEDVLLINDGTGYFTNQTASRMPFSFSQSVVTHNVQIIDMNGDGKRDICRCGVANFGDDVSIVYNGASVGNFSTRWLWTSVMGTLFAPGRILMRDMNGDGRPDLVNNAGYKVFHNGNVAGQAVFAISPPNIPYASQTIRVADLDGSGYPEIIYLSSGIQAPGGIVRNLGPTGGFLNLNPPTPLVAYAEDRSNGETLGIQISEITGGFDSAAVDLDGDGDRDLIVATATGTRIYRNVPYGEIAFSYGSAIHPDFPAFTQNSNTVTMTATGAFNPSPSSAVLVSRVDGGAILSKPLTPTAPGLFTINFPYLTRCGATLEWAISIVDPSTGAIERDPPTGYYAQKVVPSVAATILSESFETTAPGWTVSNLGTAPGGNWELAAPFGVAPSFGTQYAPSGDSEPDPTKVGCFVTENGSGELLSHDVDGGPKRLISPTLNFSQAVDPYIAFDYWYSSTSAGLLMTVEITTNGVNWTTVQSLPAQSPNQWRRFDFHPADFVTPTATTQVRFTASDPTGNFIVEAGIDHFIAGDASGCQESVGFAGPGSLTLSVCGGELSIGTTAEIRLTGVLHNDVAYFVAHPTLEPFSVAGGMIVSATPLAVAAVPTPAAGDLVLPGLIGGIGPLTLYLQALQVDGTLPEYLAFSNIVRIQFLP